MVLKKMASALTFICSVGFSPFTQAIAGEQPTAIFHAFNQPYTEVSSFVCQLADQGYSHLQISPAQKSNPTNKWWARYQPIDYSVIEGLGSEEDLKQLINQAHQCKVKVIADVVFNHMADISGGGDLEDITNFPNLSIKDFNTNSTNNPIQKPCDISYGDGDRQSEFYCWLGTLPDLKFTDNVKKIQKAHLKKLLDLGIDGFRFDAAKHIPPEVIKEYIDYINQESRGQTWNYLEVIEDNDTRAEDYNWIAAVTDFRLYKSLKSVFTFNGDVRSLPTTAVNDERSVTFGRNHDTIIAIRDNPAEAYDPYQDPTDSYLATAYVLARQDGTPLIFNEDNLNAPYLKFGVKFRQVMIQRGKEGKNVRENVLKVTQDSNTVRVMERGEEGFLVINKGVNKFEVPVMDLTLTNLEGCYRELRNNFTVAIERKNGKKFITRWGTWDKGGMEIQGRDALYFIREPFSQCQATSVSNEQLPVT